MTNLEWLEKRCLITTNDVYKETLDNVGKIGINVFIKLRGCDYSDYKEKGIGWLLEEHKESIKLKKWEKDLLKCYQETKDDGEFVDHYILTEMQYKGHFQNVDYNLTIEEILDNCEVIEK